MDNYVNINKELRERVRMLKCSTPYNDIVKLLEKRLEDIREEYEVNPASEYTRGRINELKQLIGILKA